MKFIADLHLHSKYSRAVSQEMIIPKMAEWAKLKGISVLGTGDFTHPFWFEQLKSELEEAGNGLYKLKSTVHSSQFTDKNSEQITVNREPVYFLLSCEVSSIYSQGGKGRRIHNVFFFPQLSSVEKFNNKLIKRGANLRSDGRPIVGITSRDLAEIAFSCDERALVIPAHIWTPWFSLFGSFSGFDSVEECFGDMEKYIFAIETGLSSDPLMNWQIEDLKNRAILSFSDAHSPLKIGREAVVFEADKISYDSIYQAIAGPVSSGSPVPQSVSGLTEIPSSQGTPLVATRNDARIAFTIEFYPEEGKYHFTGHRDCNFSQSPEETIKNGDICPICNRSLTIGVLHRVGELKTRDMGHETRNTDGVRWVYPEGGSRPPYVSLVPLVEIIAEALESGVGTKKVMDCYFSLTSELGGEFNVLLKAKDNELAKFVPQKVVEGIFKMRKGDIVIEPGYDGKFGQVKIWPEEQDEIKSQKGEESQLNLFAG